MNELHKCRDVLNKLRPGMKVRFIHALDYRILGEYKYVRQLNDNCIECLDCNGGEVLGDIDNLMVQFLECEHQWRRLELFRTTEFHCTQCQVSRPFDMEKDEVA